MTTLAQLKPILLASESPRRADLLGSAGLEYQVVSSDYQEKPLDLEPEELAKTHALGKAVAVAKQNSNQAGVIIGADTIVICADHILEKPKDEADARKMLNLQSKLGGATVLTGVAMLDAETGQEDVFCELTRVHLRKLSNQEIDWYISTKEWQGKSGSFAIQGLASRFFTGVEGDINNVIGLPVAQIYQRLASWGIISNLAGEI